jgi:hypothetical protein
MTDKEYVKQFFPDAYVEEETFDSWVWINLNGKTVIIGDGKSPEEAWKDARYEIDNLPEDQNPKIK